VEAGPLTALVEAVLAVAWRRDSAWHGELHWRCVTATGLDLAAATQGVERPLVFCFGLLHDTRRENESLDPGHGARAAALATELRDAGALPLGEAQLRSLVAALRLHSDGQVSRDPTIGSCWDADRLHLPRVGIEPDPTLFSTTAAREPTARCAAERLRRDGAPAWEELVARAAAG
jgi:uncharacterized protein